MTKSLIEQEFKKAKKECGFDMGDFGTMINHYHELKDIFDIALQKAKEELNKRRIYNYESDDYIVYWEYIEEVLGK